MTRPLIVSAPGSLMVLGEHAVLHGHPCLVAAIDQRVRVSIVPGNDGMVSLTSALGDYEGDREALPDHPSFRFVLAALRHKSTILPGGFDALIEADMPPTIGFGTSAAVTVAMLGALQLISGGTWSKPDIVKDARLVIQSVQGRGSGADAAASCYGGLVRYDMNAVAPRVILSTPQPITALYCGYKKPTADVIRVVQQQWCGREADLDAIFQRMATLVNQADELMRDHQTNALGTCLNEGQMLMRELGVSTPELDECVAWLRQDSCISGAKISGSGLGDCAIGWGLAQSRSTPFARYDVTVAQEGIRCE